MSSNLDRPSAPVFDENLESPILHPTECITLKPLSLRGLPEGSEPANVLRCLELLEHAVICDAGPEELCSEGSGCRRTKIVLAHHFECKTSRLTGSGGCSVCHQLHAMFHNHSIRCQAVKETCIVPYCQNNKHQQTLQNPSEIWNNAQQGEPTRREYQYIIREFSEAMNLPTKEEKIQHIKQLVIANRSASKILRHLIARKSKLNLDGLIVPMTKLAIRKKVLSSVNYRGTVSVIPLR